MRAKYLGFCYACRRGIAPGDDITKSIGVGYVHSSCAEALKPRAQTKKAVQLELFGGRNE